MNQQQKTWVLGFTGASGMPYAIRVMHSLLKRGDRVWVVVSPAAYWVARDEHDWHWPGSPKALTEYWNKEFSINNDQLKVFSRNDWHAPFASGSYPIDGMVIVPCTMRTLAAVSYGLSDHLIERAADVCIKEHRRLVLVPRETPLSPIHLEHMLHLSKLGVRIVPPMPAFYTRPDTLQDSIDFVAGKILEQLGVVDHGLIKPWMAP
jgi:4-hydroxy-3-polyprenylbenzoate decarboxylase